MTKPTSAERFYIAALKKLIDSGIQFMIGGTYAFTEHTGIKRETKDLDIFCKAGDYPRILKVFEEYGYKTQIIDARWLAKASHKDHYIDLIFASRTDLATVDDSWFKHAPEGNIFHLPVKLIPPEELIWSKAYIQHREKFDGADVNHIILKQGQSLDWQRLLMRMEAHWEVLFSHLINFRFVYPSERDIVPKWLMEELLSRSQQQLTLPNPQDKVCRGHLLANGQYDIDFEKWGFLRI